MTNQPNSFFSKETIDRCKASKSEIWIAEAFGERFQIGIDFASGGDWSAVGYSLGGKIYITQITEENKA